MTSAVSRCSAIIEDLLQTYREDRNLAGTLESLRGSIQLGLQSLPLALLRDLEQLLAALRDSKVEINRLWSEIFDLKERITNLRSWADTSDKQIREDRLLHSAEVEELRQDIRDLQRRVQDTEDSLADARIALDETRKKLAMRQVLHALNEKLLARIQQKLGMEQGAFWRQYALNNVGKIRGQPLEKAWQELQEEYGITAQPDIYWRLLKGCKLPLDTYVHGDSFDRLPYEELKAEAEKFYVDSKALHKATFLDALELSKRISEATKTSMYDNGVGAMA